MLEWIHCSKWKVPVARLTACPACGEPLTPSSVSWHIEPQCGHVENPREVNTFRDESRTRAVGVDNSAERAQVPYELIESIRVAVEDAYQNPPPRQSELPQVTADGGCRNGDEQ